MSSVPCSEAGEHNIILGDFIVCVDSRSDVCVGSRSDVDADQWSGVLEMHGYGVANTLRY